MSEIQSNEAFTIRMETADDVAAVHAVATAAFGHTDEADLVDRLRADGDVLLSLVGLRDEQIVGHVLFSRMWIVTAAKEIAAVALAPVAVLPESQKLGIGGALICTGIEMLRDRGEGIVIVLGEPEYYTRFGFAAEKACSLASPFPPEAYMAMELCEGALNGVAGTVRYGAAFGL